MRGFICALLFFPLIIVSAQPVSEKDHININPYYRYHPELTDYFYQKEIYDRNKERIHRKSFIAIDKQNFGLDKHVVYYAQSHNGSQIIIGADPFSFRLITSVGANQRESSFGHYSRDDNYIFYRDDKINSADPATFEVLGRNYGGNLSYNYAIDKNYVFEGAHILVGADPNTFNPISDKFSVDAQHIFVDHKLIKGSDSQTYKRIDEGYSKDKNQVYFNEKDVHNSIITIDGADPDTFEVITINFNERGRGGVRRPHFARDKNRVYHLGKELKGVDSQTFKVLNENFARDNKKLYALYLEGYQNRFEEIEGIDPDQFKATAVSFLYQYNKGLYYKTGELRLIEGVDLSTFEVFNYKETEDFTDTIYAKDKSRLYWISTHHFNSLDLPAKIDPLQLSILNHYYFYDNKTVYFRALEPERQGEKIWILQPVVGADVETFKVDGDSAIDKNGEYYKGIRIEIDRP